MSSVNNFAENQLFNLQQINLKNIFLKKDMVVVSNDWLEHEAEVHTFLRTNGLMMSAQSGPFSNTTCTISNWKKATDTWPQQQQTQQQQQQQQLQTLLPNQQQIIIEDNQGPPNVVKSPQAALAVLICHPSSHQFQNRTIILEPNQETKIGRSVARNRVGENNSIFDCKVLSRNHAVLWYANGKFFIKDTGSSNGTFINNQRLSPTCVHSEPCEVSSGDVVQFGVDVMENTRKETHGCIVGTLKLYLPDGRETKTSQSTSVCRIPAEDLYRLNQYIQEAVQREQILETKLLNLQKIVDLTRKNSSSTWQAMIDEDRLLSRIDILENKLQCFQKNVTDDKLRDEVIKLQEDKNVYQNSAKEALRKVYQERMEASQKLIAIERALCNSEDECSLLRDQLFKAQQNLQEVTVRLGSLQTKYDELIEKCALTEANEKQLALESQSIGALLKQQILECHQTKDQLETIKKEKDNLKSRLGNFETCDNEENAVLDLYGNKMSVFMQKIFAKSDLKNKEGSEDIIKAICNDTDLSDDLNNMQMNYSKIYDKLLEIENNFSILDVAIKETVENNGETEPPIETSEVLSDGNQNMSIENSEIVKSTIFQLKDVYSELMKQLLLSREKEDKTQEKYHELESKLMSVDMELQTLQLELEIRPTYNQFQEKIKLNEQLQNDLQSLKMECIQLKEDIEKSEITQQQLLSNGDELMDTKRDDEGDEDIKVVEKQDADVQTENIVDEDYDEVVLNTKLEKTESSLNNLVASPTSSSSSSSTSTSFVNGDTNIVNISNSSSSNNISSTLSFENDIKILNDPFVQSEEELIIVKENYAKLTEENILLRKSIDKLQKDYDRLHYKSMIQILIYIAPFIAIIGYLLISPYL